MMSFCCRKGALAGLSPFAPRKWRGPAAAFAERKATEDPPRQKVVKNAIATALVLAVAFILFASGCSDRNLRHAAISGEVKLDGRPLEDGSIIFTPIDGAQGKVAGGPIKNGRYQLLRQKGPTVGPNSVEIHGSRKTGKPARPSRNPLEQGAEEYEEAVAPRFNSASTLRFEVKPGENTANFEVSSK
jgi:hypothetical protein